MSPEPVEIAEPRDIAQEVRGNSHDRNGMF